MKTPPKWVLAKLSQKERSQYSTYTYMNGNCRTNLKGCHRFGIGDTEIVISRMGKIYLSRNLCHRLNGPAVVDFLFREKQWWINGVRWDI